MDNAKINFAVLSEYAKQGKAGFLPCSLISLSKKISKGCVGTTKPREIFENFKREALSIFLTEAFDASYDVRGRVIRMCIGTEKSDLRDYICIDLNYNTISWEPLESMVRKEAEFLNSIGFSINYKGYKSLSELNI